MKPAGWTPWNHPAGRHGAAGDPGGHRADTVLMGNLEVSDIENLPTAAFEQKVRTACAKARLPGPRLRSPSLSCPYGRVITARTLANYETMIRLAENWAG